MWMSFKRIWAPEENPGQHLDFSLGDLEQRHLVTLCGLASDLQSCENNKWMLDCFKPPSLGIPITQTSTFSLAALAFHMGLQHSQGCSHFCWHSQDPSYQPSWSAHCVMQPLSSPRGRGLNQQGETIVRSTACHFVPLTPLIEYLVWSWSCRMNEKASHVVCLCNILFYYGNDGALGCGLVLPRALLHTSS